MNQQGGRLGTFGGVFTPTLLTILGVIMYLRLGWVVGNGGLLGALLVMGLAIAITTTTGLSLSSISTNTRLGAGGPYAIISHSLGLEVGGAVGVPLFFSQALAVAMYVFGFREGWLWFFPAHSALAVDLCAFAGVFAIAYVSAELAFKVQYVIMAVIAVSLVLVLASPAGWTGDVEWTGSWRGAPEDGFTGTDFWAVFAVFFPAATGIMAGANMSGELRDPRHAIPLGTMAAIAVSTLVYLALAVWLSRAGTAEELTSNYTLMADASLWGPGVLIGLLGATLSSAMSSLVGAPRILLALARDGIVRDVGGIGRVSESGEPRRAMLVSGAVVLLGLLLRDLNAIAPLITMFFLITYGVINVVVLLEGSLGLQSYRPTLRVSRLVPLLGALGCTFAMFIINPTVSLLSLGVVFGLYAVSLRRGLGRAGDSRSGIFAAIAEWAAARATELEAENPRAWKPNLLVPAQDTPVMRGSFQLLHEFVAPEGSIKLLGVAAQETVSAVSARMSELTRDFRRKGVFTTYSVLDSTDFESAVVSGLQALRSAFFRPNVLFLSLSPGTNSATVERLWAESRRLRVGLALLARHPEAGMGERAVIHLWLPPGACETHVSLSLTTHGLHLAILTALRLQRAWGAKLRVYAVVDDEAGAPAARAWLAELQDAARLPSSVELAVMAGETERCLASAPQSDLDIFALPHEPDLSLVRRSVELTRSACLFLGDSGNESALA